MTKEEKEEIIKLREQGYKRVDIAKQLMLEPKRVQVVLDYAIRSGKIKRKNKDYRSMSQQDLLDIVKQYVSKDRAPAGLRSKIYRDFGGWSNALAAAEMPPNIGGVVDFTRPMMLYLLDFGAFKKFGVTQKTLRERFPNAPSYVVLDTLLTDAVTALEFETLIKQNVNQFIPDNPYFERNGKTECFVGQGIKLEDLV